MESSNQFLGTERIGKLMRKYAIPCIISLLVGSLYNIVDQIFIANASYLGSYGNTFDVDDRPADAAGDDEKMDQNIHGPLIRLRRLLQMPALLLPASRSGDRPPGQFRHGLAEGASCRGYAHTAGSPLLWRLPKCA